MLKDIQVILKKHITGILISCKKEAEQVQLRESSIKKEKIELSTKMEKLKIDYRQKILKKYLLDKIKEEEKMDESIKN